MTDLTKRVLFALAVVSSGIFFLGYRNFHTASSINFRKYEKRGNQLFGEKKIPAAIKSWQKSSAFTTSPEKVYNKIGIAYLAKNDYENAIKVFRQGLKVNPKDVILLYNLGLCFFQLKNNKMALKNLKEVEMLDPYYLNVHYLRGVIYERMGLRKEAKKEYIKELNINPRSISAWAKLKTEE